MKPANPSEKAVTALLGRTHAPRRPGMTEETRRWITGVMDEEYRRGRFDGIESVTRSAVWREIGMLAGGLAVGSIAMWRILA